MGEKSLSKIGSAFGNPLVIDERAANKLCVSYARMLVDVDITQELSQEITIKDNEGNKLKQIIEYEWKPLFCRKCKRRDINVMWKKQRRSNGHQNLNLLKKLNTPLQQKMRIHQRLLCKLMSSNRYGPRLTKAAFVLGQQIHNHILLAYEMVKGYTEKEFGLPHQFITWIMLTMTRVSYKFNINREYSRTISFLWTGGADISRKSPIAWKNVCKTRKQGGLNIIDLYTLNRITLMKLLWNLSGKSNNL
ncbi:hypothetical protein KIW84_063204 [Lathyrus oleraceus]|uniref:Uncharacterized protein n=1 Tax=Pisum sativum TaxID=3888 RepID=A0A9D4WAJ5_PEA|nr:hypothetical protein KIW84_063204 [Pisum sativum]